MQFIKNTLLAALVVASVEATTHTTTPAIPTTTATTISVCPPVGSTTGPCTSTTTASAHTTPLMSSSIMSPIHPTTSIPVMHYLVTLNSTNTFTMVVTKTACPPGVECTDKHPMPTGTGVPYYHNPCPSGGVCPTGHPNGPKHTHVPLTGNAARNFAESAAALVGVAAFAMIAL